MPDDDSTRRQAAIETTLTIFGETQKATNEKLDKLVSGLGDFKVEVTQGFGEITTAVGRVDQSLTERSGELTRRLDGHGIDLRTTELEIREEMRALEARTSGPSKGQATAALGGAGMLGVLLDRIYAWFSGGGTPPA